MATNTAYGTVMDDSTGKTVAKSVVKAECGSTTQSTTTDDDGYFEFDNLPATTCTFVLAQEWYSITGFTIVPNDGGGDVITTSDGDL
ncbi:MAG TPA: carboxypeptidase regulatory-like domain-containing protein [Thermoanaerobaculia bacterium]